MGVSSSAKKYSVYDFHGEEEPVEIPPRRFLKNEKPKKNPKTNPLPPNDNMRVDVVTFLQSFTQGTKKQGKNFLNDPVDVDDVPETDKDRISASDAASQSSSSHCRPETYCGAKYLDSRAVYSGSDFSTLRSLSKATGPDHVDSTIPHFLSDNEPVRINSDDDNEIELTSTIPSSDLTDPAGPSGEQVLELGSSECDIEPIVVVSPKLVCYCKKRYWNAQLIFSCSSIKLDVSNVNAIIEPSILEWRTADLVKIESKWLEQFKTANVCLHLKSEDGKVAGNAKTPGIVELRFAVCDPLWSQREEAIKFLDVRYIDKWDVDSNFDVPFEDVFYPEGDPDSISITKRDIELLQPERFINDTIVDFYIKYLKNKVKPEDSHRFYFFNSFFFRKLADYDSNSSRACRGRDAFQRVRKWTKKMNIFQKDYVFIPVNFSLHWSLIVICHPGEVVDFSDEETEKSVKVPCILHMDSIKGSHRGVKNIIQSYLLEEWKERSTNPAEDVASKFSNLRFLPLELPQQQNSFDCALFMLHYMELFVEQAPVKFSPFRLSKSSRFLNKDWFPPSAASLKRAHIKKLVFEIAKHNSRKVPSSACDECSSEFTDLNKQGTEELLQEAYNSNETCHESSLHTNAVQPINLTPLAIKPLRSVYVGESDFGGFTEPGLYKGSPIDGNDQPFGQMVLRNPLINVLSTIEEEEETPEQTACSPTKAVCDLPLALIPEPSAKMDAHLSFELLPPDYEEFEKEDGITGTDSGESPLASEMHKKGNYTLELSGSSSDNTQVICECSSTSSEELEACVIKDSQEENGELDASVCDISRCQRRLFAPTNKKGDLSVENIVPTNHMPTTTMVPCIIEDSEEEIEGPNVGDNENYHPRRRLFDSINQQANPEVENTHAHQVSPMLDSEEVPCLKRPRLMSRRTERRVTRSLSEGIEEIVIL